MKQLTEHLTAYHSRSLTMLEHLQTGPLRLVEDEGEDAPAPLRVLNDRIVEEIAAHTLALEDLGAGRLTLPGST